MTSADRDPGLGTLLSVDDVMDRYRLTDRRSARRVMDDIGAFRVGRGLFVTAADVVDYEATQRRARTPRAAPDPPLDGIPPPRGRRPATRRREPPPPGWWRDSVPGPDGDDTRRAA